MQETNGSDRSRGDHLVCSHKLLRDFSSGGFSLDRLHKLEVDVLKIDREVVRLIDDNEWVRKMIESILVLCAVLDIKVIAEGVETEQELSFLREKGCEYIQGH